jgi:serine/threonine protein kinase
VSTDLVLGGYRLRNLLMSGQASQVWEAVQEGSHRHFAVKLLLPHVRSEREHRLALAHEAQVGLQLEHPDIIRVVEFVKDRENPFLVMELFPSPNLKVQILRGDAIVREGAHRVVCRVAGALAYVHEKGWVHRDVKPDNILVNRAAQIRLIDFALAARVQGRLSRLLGRKPKVQGTRSYMAPEQILGKALSPATDVYSLGALLYELVTGRPPFVGNSPNDLLVRHIYAQASPPSMHNASITPELDAIVLRMLAKKPKDRFANLHEFLAEFRNLRIFKDDPVPQSEVMG